VRPIRTTLSGLWLLLVCLVVVFGACRRNHPSLVDTNEAPETELWYAPPDSSDQEYLVHLYWRGRDNDGVVERYIWTVVDTLVPGEGSWNPTARLADYRSGRITARSDSVFAFTAFKNVGGVGVKKNRQAFYIAAIDDHGAIDPSPAAVEFVATIDLLPRIFFATRLQGVWKPFIIGAAADTVGMYETFAMSYHGTTTNGRVRGYLWFPLGTTVKLPGANRWTSDVTDTLRTFTNTGAERLPAGTFRFAARCIDDARAESRVDAGTFGEGVCQVVVNFDPDTRIHNLNSTYFRGNVKYEETIDFTDGQPDTVPYRSWLRVDYSGWDDARDGKLCPPPSVKPDRCIDFQFRYFRVCGRVPGSFDNSGWLPRGGYHDTDTLSASDSNSVNIGSLEYDFFVRSVDENLTPDGTAPSVHIVGNFDPILDDYSLSDHLGNSVDVSTVDTLTWDWWKPANSDTIVFNPSAGTIERKKVFRWRIGAAGHDHPKDPINAGIQAWRYFIYTGYGTASQKFWPLARAGTAWVAGPALNQLAEAFALTFVYSRGDINADPNGDAVFASLPAYFDDDITIVLVGRDTPPIAPAFEQWVWLNGGRVLDNSFAAASYGRYTRPAVYTFHFRMVR